MKHRPMTDVKFADSSNEMNGSVHPYRERCAGTVRPSAESMLLIITGLLTSSVRWTRNCETHSGVSFGTSIKHTLERCSREGNPSSVHKLASEAVRVI